MKNNVSSIKQALPVLVLGIVGLILRRTLYSLTVDGKNLLPTSHPLQTALWVLSLAVLVLIILAVRNQKGSGLYQDHFRASPAGAVSSAALAVGILLTAVEGGIVTAGVQLLRTLLGIIAAGALLVEAVCRWQGKTPFFLIHGVVCVFFAIYMVSCYQGWSSNPQIQDYVFSLLATVGLMLFSYQQACFDADAGKCRTQLALGMFTAFCCFVAVSGTQNVILYLTGGIWCICNLCSPRRGE